MCESTTGNYYRIGLVHDRAVINYKSKGKVLKKITALIVVTSLASGCASITGSEIQSVSVTTHASADAAVEKAKCTLRNDKGVWEVTTPAFVGVRRSAEDLTVECKKEGQPDGLLKAISRAAGGMFGNIVFGGGIGALIDHNKGTGYDYPDILKVIMGKSTVIDKKDQTDQPAGEKTADASPR